MKKWSVGILSLLCIWSCSSEDKTGQESAPQPMVSKPAPAESADSISVKDLATWRFLGAGVISIDETENALLMSEGPDSKGVNLISPKKYGQTVVVSYKIKPLTYESVHVLILSASEKDTGGDIQVPGDYDGNFDFWTAGNVQDYVFALHNAAHNRKPFITKNPGVNLISEAGTDVTGEQWHEVEIGRHGAHLFMKIDGKMVVEGMDPAGVGLPGGIIGFRLRGVPGKAASALFKDVVIEKSKK
jgi:hypothetical protein